MLDSPDWLAVTAKAAKFDPYVALLDVCIGIPRILERTDKLTAPGTSPEAVEKLIDDSQKLASRGFQWFADFEKNGSRYTKVDVGDMDGFLDICDATTEADLCDTFISALKDASSNSTNFAGSRVLRDKCHLRRTVGTRPNFPHRCL